MKYVCGATIELGDKVVYRRNGEDLICEVIRVEDGLVSIYAKITDNTHGECDFGKRVMPCQIVKA